MSVRGSARLGVVVMILGVALMGLGVALVLFARWSDVSTRTPADAMALLDAARRSAASTPPYVEIDSRSGVRVHHELEPPEPRPIRTLVMLAWDPQHQRLVRLRLPWWFVRIKMPQRIDLGPIAALLGRAGDPLATHLTRKDLERRGPGWILDHTSETGVSVVMWTEGPTTPSRDP